MRYLPLTPDDRRAMLRTIDVANVDALFRDVPKEAVVGREAFAALPDTQGELEVERTLSRIAAKNVAAGSVPFFCGAGAYRRSTSPTSVCTCARRSSFSTGTGSSTWT